MSGFFLEKSRQFAKCLDFSQGKMLARTDEKLALYR